MLSLGKSGGQSVWLSFQITWFVAFNLYIHQLCIYRRINMRLSETSQHLIHYCFLSKINHIQFNTCICKSIRTDVCVLFDHRSVLIGVLFVNCNPNSFIGGIDED
ncbi:hypothetical protein L1987_22844 [Smallanthus sonchifolius]|uniref:Uncharacterized protein n=1 Tax=Smallanthus sonchifolius TaxID=185202 RepID=A0ACB9IHF5_9ASTR|nr:hypothetical protein L1987_22844 [Smallanthus sonchifolius]